MTSETRKGLSTRTTLSVRGLGWKDPHAHVASRSPGWGGCRVFRAEGSWMRRVSPSGPGRGPHISCGGSRQGPARGTHLPCGLDAPADTQIQDCPAGSRAHDQAPLQRAAVLDVGRDVERLPVPEVAHRAAALALPHQPWNRRGAGQGPSTCCWAPGAPGGPQASLSSPRGHSGDQKQLCQAHASREGTGPRSPEASNERQEPGFTVARERACWAQTCFPPLSTWHWHWPPAPGRGPHLFC